MKFQVIKKVNGQFTVSSIDALDREDIRSKRTFYESQEIYPYLEADGWNINRFSGGEFIFQWHTNFNWGKQSFSNLHVLFCDLESETETVIDVLEDIDNLEDVAFQMNRFTHLSPSEFKALFTNVVKRLGYYRKCFQVAGNVHNYLDKGYSKESYLELATLDSDKYNIKALLKTQQAAIDLQRNLIRVERFLSILKLKPERNEELLKRLEEEIARTYRNYGPSVPLTFNGRAGNSHFINCTLDIF